MIKEAILRLYLTYGMIFIFICSIFSFSFILSASFVSAQEILVTPGLTQEKGYYVGEGVYLEPKVIQELINKGYQFRKSSSGSFTDVVDSNNVKWRIIQPNSKGPFVLAKVKQGVDEIDTTNTKKVSDVLKEAPGGGKPEAPGAGTIPFFGMNLPDKWGSHLLAGVAYAGAVYGGLEFFANMFGVNEGGKKAVQFGASSGVMVYQAFKAYFSTAGGKGKGVLGLGKEGMIGQYAGPISVGIAVAVFLATYKKEKTELITFMALPWQPPTGGR